MIGIPTLAATDPELGRQRRPASASRSRATSSGTSRPRSSGFGHVINSHRAYLGVSDRRHERRPGRLVAERQLGGGPAAKAGLRAGDVITAVNGHSTPTVDDLTSVLSELKPGQRSRWSVVTQSGTHKTLHLTLGTFPGG